MLCSTSRAPSRRAGWSPGVVTLVAFSGLVAGVAHRGAQAAPIIWGAPQTITGEADVSTSGTLVYAYNIGEEGVPFTTINGVLFNSFEFPTDGVTSTASTGSVTFTESVGALNGTLGLGSMANPYAGLDAAYRVLLDSGGFATAVDVMSGTLGDLTIGQIYDLQVWTSNAAMLTVLGSNLQLTTLAATNEVTLDANTTNADGGIGQYVIGRFTADATSQVFTLTGQNVPTDLPLLNGFQVRAVPEPSTYALALAGLAGGAVLRRRRRTPGPDRERGSRRRLSRRVTALRDAV